MVETVNTINIPFWQTLTAVMAGNLLTVLMLYGFYRAGQEDSSWTDYVMIAVPLLLASTGFYLIS